MIARGLMYEGVQTQQKGKDTEHSRDILAALVASCFRGAGPPVSLRDVCFVLAIRSF
jgi:hypothetical protein